MAKTSTAAAMKVESAPASAARRTAPRCTRRSPARSAGLRKWMASTDSTGRDAPARRRK
ncbi:MAG: hypothetical protein QM765_46460 [Myxococcales bacterium]